MLRTLLLCKLGIRQFYNLIQSIDSKRGSINIFLGSMLVKNRDQSAAYHYLNILKQENIAVVIRLLEPVELNTHVPFYRSLPTDDELAVVGGCQQVFTVSCPDYIADWSEQCNQITKRLFDSFSEVLQFLQKEGDSKSDCVSPQFSQLGPRDDMRRHIFFHCKGGVNRSFKACVAFLVFLKFKDSLINGCSIDVSDLRDTIQGTCQTVKEKRNCVAYSDSYAKRQVAFILQMFKSYYGKQISNDFRDIIDLLSDYEAGKFRLKIAYFFSWPRSANTKRKIALVKTARLQLENTNISVDVIRKTLLVNLKNDVRLIREGGDFLKRVLPRIEEKLKYHCYEDEDDMQPLLCRS